MENKYISFDPCFCGLCNVIMSYEVAFAISHITKRKIILPPKTWLSHIEKFVDIWEIFDKDVVKSEFRCVEFEDVPEIKNNINFIKGERSYTQNIERYVKGTYRVGFVDENNETEDKKTEEIINLEQSKMLPPPPPPKNKYHFRVPDIIA